MGPLGPYHGASWLVLEASWGLKIHRWRWTRWTRAAVAGKDTQDDGLGFGMLPREGASRPEDRRKARTEFGAEKGHAPFGRDDQLVE